MFHFQKYHISSLEMFHVSSKNTSNPEMPYFIPRNTPASSSKTLHFQRYYSLSLEIVHFQKCFISSNVWNPERLHLYSRKGPPLSPEMFMLHLPKCHIFKTVPPPEMLSVSSLEMSSPYPQKCHVSCSKNIPSLEMPMVAPERSLAQMLQRLRNPPPSGPSEEGLSSDQEASSCSFSLAPMVPWGPSATCRACTRDQDLGWQVSSPL